VVEQVMYKKNIFHRIQNKFIDLKIGAEKELKILTSLKFNKQTAAYAGWVGYDNLGDEVLYQSYIKLFHSFCFIPYKSNSIVERYYKLIKKQVYDIVVLGHVQLLSFGILYKTRYCTSNLSPRGPLLIKILEGKVYERYDIVS
jgi:hypothetical protein